MFDKKILYACQQISPFTESCEVADNCRLIPTSIAELGPQVRIFIPRYGVINERRNQLHEVIRLSGMNLIISDNDHQLIIKVASVPGSRQQVYFVDNEDFFRRKALIRDKETGKFFNDNDQRALFFARGVLETVKKLRWEPDCLHIHGWIGAFIPAYLKYKYKDDPIFSNIKVILSIYESDYFSEKLAADIAAKLKFEKIVTDEADILNDPTYENLIKFVLQFCSGVIYVGNITNSIKEYVTSLNIPSMEQQGNFDKEQYLEFYETILGK